MLYLTNVLDTFYSVTYFSCFVSSSRWALGEEVAEKGLSWRDERNLMIAYKQNSWWWKIVAFVQEKALEKINNLFGNNVEFLFNLRTWRRSLFMTMESGDMFSVPHEGHTWSFSNRYETTPKIYEFVLRSLVIIPWIWAEGELLEFTHMKSRMPQVRLVLLVLMCWLRFLILFQ